MLPFHPSAAGRDAPRPGGKRLALDLAVLVLTAVLMATSVWFGAGNGTTTGNAPREQAQKQGIGRTPPHASAQSGRAP